MSDMDLMRADYPVMVRFPGPMVYSFRTSMCKDCHDVRTLWRLSYRSFRCDADYVQRDPDAFFRMLRQHGWTGELDVRQYVDALCWAMRKDSSVVRVDVSRLESRRDIRTAFRLEERYTFHGVKRTPVLNKALRMVRKWEDAGLVCDDYAAILDSAISEIVNGRTT